MGTEFIAWAIALGCGGFVAWKAASEARKTRTRQQEDRPDRLAILRREVETYRAEVTDLSDRVDRWFRRVEKREEREQKAKAGEDVAPAEAEISTGISTGFPQPGAVTKDQLRAYAFNLRRRR